MKSTFEGKVEKVYARLAASECDEIQMAARRMRMGRGVSVGIRQWEWHITSPKH